MANEQLDKLAQPIEQTVKLEVNVNELNVIFGALQEAPLPHRVSDPVLKKIFGQAQEQLPQPPKGQPQ
jgi:hypothetical protein